MATTPSLANSSVQQQSGWFILKLADLSFTLENIPIKSTSLILVFFLTQTLLDVILPCFMLISNQQNNMDFVDKLLNIFITWSTQEEFLVTDMFVAQFFISVVLIGTLVALVTQKGEKVKIIALCLIQLIFCTSTLVLFVSIETLLHLIQLNSAIAIVGSLWCGINILIVLLFCIFYKFLANSYSTVVPNALCSRYDYLEIAKGFGMKIFSTLVLLLVTIKLLWPQGLGNTRIFFIFFLIVILAMNLVSLKNQLFFFTYFYQISSKVYQACLILEISCVFNTLLCLITDLQLLVQNYLFSICSLFMFSYLAMVAYLGMGSRNFLLRSQQQILNEEELILLIVELNKLSQVEYIKNAELTELFMIKNIYKRHEDTCLEVDCYCKNKQIDKNDLEAMTNLYQLAILSFMDNCSSKHQNRVQITKFTLAGKLHVHRNFAGLSHLDKVFKLKVKTTKTISNTLFFHKYHLALKQYLDSQSNCLSVAQTQKCLESAKLNETFIKKLTEMIHLRSKFWGVLYKGVINDEFQHKIQKQLLLLKELYDFMQKVIKEYQNNLFLINLSIGYQKTILMKDKISKQLITCIEKIRVEHGKHTKMALKSNKKSKIEQMMYQKTSCTIEVSIDQTQIGKIIQGSRNVYHVFGYLQKDIVGGNINKLMPKSMQKQHDCLIRDWTQKCSWNNIGQLRTIFCMNKQNICFSCKIYLKPILRTDCVNLVGCFFKDNDQDYMIIDHQGIIVAAGNLFMNMLGPNIIRIPLQFIVDGIEQLQKWATHGDQITHSQKFYSTKNNIELYEHYQQQKCIFETKKVLRQQICASKDQTQWFALKFTIRNIYVGRVKFQIIKLEGLGQNKPTLKMIQSLKAMTEKQIVDQKDNIKNSESIEHQSDLFLHYNPSISSSSSSQPTATHNVIYKMQKIFYAISQIYDRRSINIVVTVVVLCFLGIFMDVGKIYINEKGFKQMQELFFADGACSDNLQISMFIYNNALTLNQKLLVHQQTLQANDISLIAQLRQNLLQQKYQQEYLYNLVREQIKYYNSNRTSLTNINMYKYENNMVKWKGPSLNFKEIQTTSFMVNFMYLSSECLKLAMEAVDILTNSSTPEFQHEKVKQIRKQLEFYLNILHDNFPELEQMNSQNLLYYADLLLQNKSMIKLVSYIKTVITILIFLVLLVLLNKHYNYRRDQTVKIYEEYRHIPVDRVTSLINYYFMLGKIIKQDENDHLGKRVIREKMTDYLEIDTGALLKLNEINDQYNSTHNKKQTRPTTGLKIAVERPNLYLLKIFFVTIFVCVVGINILMDIAEQHVLTKSEEIVGYINDLMESENKLIGTYFTQKSQHISGVVLNHQELKSLLVRVKKVEVQFTNVAMGSLELFSAYDPSYVQKMSKILTENVCELNKGDLPQQQYQKCIKESDMDIIKHGIINGMNYFGREIENLIWRQIKNKKDGNQLNYSLEKVDKTLFHMFKIYQKTQIQITDSLVIVIHNQKTQYLLEIIVQLLIFLVFLSYIGVFYCRQNQECMMRVGKILLLPVSIIKGDLKLLRNFEKIVDYQYFIER